MVQGWTAKGELVTHDKEDKVKVLNYPFIQVNDNEIYENKVDARGMSQIFTDI